MSEVEREVFSDPYPPQEYVPVRTIATPLPRVSERLIQLRLPRPPESTDTRDDPEDKNILREPTVTDAE